LADERHDGTAHSRFLCVVCVDDEGSPARIVPRNAENSTTKAVMISIDEILN
jgi:hypothetical protein